METARFERAKSSALTLKRAVVKALKVCTVVSLKSGELQGVDNRQRRSSTLPRISPDALGTSEG